MNPGRDPTRPPFRAARAAAEPADADELLAPSTQIVADRDAYLGQGRNDVGRRIAADQVELFISADIAGSLQQQFGQHRPEFITLHDVGTSASLRLLASLAAVAATPVQKLSIRRQGHGVALAVLQFIELPLADATVVRLYSSDFDADDATRSQVARTLLGFSRLGVLLVGALAPNALTGQLKPLHEAMARGPWPNRDLLMVPLGSSAPIATQAQLLAGDSPVAVHVTPQAGQPRQAWDYIGGAWNRLHGQPGGERALPAELAAAAAAKASAQASEAATEPMGLRPELPAPAPAVAGQAGSASWQTYADRCALIKGSLSCCVFESHSGRTLAHAGGPPAADALAQQGAALLATMHEATRTLGLGGAQGESSVSTASHHLLLRPVPGHNGIAVHLVLQAAASNLTLARMQLERIEPPK